MTSTTLNFSHSNLLHARRPGWLLCALPLALSVACGERSSYRTPGKTTPSESCETDASCRSSDDRDTEMDARSSSSSGDHTTSEPAATEQPSEPTGTAASTGANDSSDDGPCAAEIDAPTLRPYAGLLEQYDYTTPVHGEPGCSGRCGYVYDADDTWVYDSELVCPLDISTCEELGASLRAVPPPCNSVADCTSYTGTLQPCEPLLDAPTYFDSALYTPEQRATHAAILAEMRRLGCREANLGWDGPTFEVDCVDNQCELVATSYCGAAPLDDASTPDLDAGAGD